MSKTPRPSPSLRLRLLILASVVLLISLGLVGSALDAAFKRSVETGVQQRLESYVYLVLAAAEVGPAGNLTVTDDLPEPRINQPGSGVYVHLHSTRDHWSSPSTLGMQLPEVAMIEAGQTRFLSPTPQLDFYHYQYGLGWEMPDGEILPMTISVLEQPDAVAAQLSAFRRGLWRWLGGAGLLLVLAQLTFLHLGLRPLQRIIKDVSGIESGDQTELEQTYPRELRPLTQNINRLLKTEKANQKRYRSALDSLAHSLKTPLAVMRSALESKLTNREQTMAGALDEMQVLISKQLERAAASTRRTHMQPVPVAEQVQRVLTGLKKVYSQKMISTRVMIDPGAVFFGERRDLLEILGNLLDNACKYGAGEVHVAAHSIRAEDARSGLSLTVEDNGRGIAADAFHDLLQRGVRGDERVEGHGLGLALVADLVESYGGRLELRASALGGAAIQVSIPPS